MVAAGEIVEFTRQAQLTMNPPNYRVCAIAVAAAWQI